MLRIVALVMFEIPDELEHKWTDILVNGLDNQIVRLQTGDYKNLLSGTILSTHDIDRPVDET